MSLSQIAIEKLSKFESRILKRALNVSKYSGNSKILAAMEIMPLESLLKIQKIRLLTQLLRNELTVNIIRYQTQNWHEVQEESLVKQVLDSLNYNIDNLNLFNNDFLITLNNEISHIKNMSFINQNTPEARAIRHLLNNRQARKKNE